MTRLRRAVVRRFALPAFALLSAIAIGPQTWAQVSPEICGPLQAGHVGPWDYRTAPQDDKNLVEGAHFLPVTEALIRGKSGNVGQELQYTLQAFPNHHRAINAAVRWSIKMRSPVPLGMKYPIECYFERALRWRSDDLIVRMMYAQWLHENKRTPEALWQLDFTSKKAVDAFTHYNLGLLYLEFGEFDLALAQAHRAMADGFPRPELRQRLEAAGRWRDLAMTTEPGASVAPSAAASTGAH